MRFAIAVSLLLFLSVPVSAQDEQIVLPVPEATGNISADYFDDSYLREEGVQHLGVDIPAPDGSPVVSPIDGTVIINRTNVSDPFNAYLVIRSNSTGFEHILAHLKSDLAVPATVNAGDTLGTIVKAGSGPHLHYGINQLSVAAALDPVAGWGFGRAPADATPLDAGMRGWLAPNHEMIRQLLRRPATSPTYAEWWSAGLVLEGSGKQNNGTSWTIRIEIQQGGSAKIAYQSIPCSGLLTVISRSRDKVIAAEEITENRSNCISGGVVEIERENDNDFSYLWRKGSHLSIGSLRSGTPVSGSSDKPASSGYIQPERGSPLRRDILDAVRPSVVGEFGNPVEFVVDEMRVEGSIAYVELWAQRPGGVPIEPASTPRFQSGRWDDLGNDLRWVSGFLRNTNGRWEGYDIVFGASEAWWVGDCTGLGVLMPETCGSQSANASSVALPKSQRSATTPNGIREAGTDLVSQNPCDNAQWSGLVTNIRDLFECDQGRAIAALSSGLPIQFTIKKVSLKDGWLYLETFTRGSYGDSLADKTQRTGNIDNWGQWLTLSSDLGWRIICLRTPSAGISFSVGDTFKGRGKLTQYEGSTVVLDCR